MNDTDLTRPRHRPVEIAPDTWVIQDTQGEGTAPQAVHLNSMLIRGAEPVVVDTGSPANRDRFLEDLFSLVEPEDVRWVFISHDDVDHFGNLHQVMDACPNATMVATWFLCERIMCDRLDVAPTRWRWLGDGESFDAGDRTLHAIRPPLYDSPTTRGLFDDRTGVYWASDCYATPVERGTEFVADLDPEAWREGFGAFQHWNSPWVGMVEADAFAATCRRIEQLRPSAIATAHGPTIEASHVQRAFELLREVPTTPAPPQPDQAVLDAMLGAMAGAS
ncbi:MAG: MBL fold metallo-hydrolase [Microthrixaceae bacterium]